MPTVDELAAQLLEGLTDEEQWGLAAQLRTEQAAYDLSVKTLLARIPVPTEKVVLSDGSSINRISAKSTPTADEMANLVTAIDPSMSGLFPLLVTAKTVEEALRLSAQDTNLRVATEKLRAAYDPLVTAAKTRAVGQVSHSISVNKEAVAAMAIQILSAQVPADRLERPIEREIEPVGASYLERFRD